MIRCAALLLFVFFLAGCGFKLAEPFTTGYYERRGGFDTGYYSPSEHSHHRYKHYDY